MKIGCLHATAGLQNFPQRTMSKLFESQREAVVSPVATTTACVLLIGRVIIDNYQPTVEVKKRKMPGVTTAVSCEASHGTVASD
jgi:hypothetical protein